MMLGTQLYYEFFDETPIALARALGQLRKELDSRGVPRIGERPPSGPAHSTTVRTPMVPVATAEVEGEQLGGLGEQQVKGGAMPLGQIQHVDVVADAGSVRGGPVGAVHPPVGPTAGGHLAGTGE